MNKSKDWYHFSAALIKYRATIHTLHSQSTAIHCRIALQFNSRYLKPASIYVDHLTNHTATMDLEWTEKCLSNKWHKNMMTFWLQQQWRTKKQSNKYWILTKKWQAKETGCMKWAISPWQQNWSTIQALNNVSTDCTNSSIINATTGLRTFV